MKHEVSNCKDTFLISLVADIIFLPFKKANFAK